MTALDAAININNVEYQYSSISQADTTYRTKFKEYGYYSMSDLIYNIQIDSSTPPLAQSPFLNSDVVVLFINTNACHNRNIALMSEAQDPGGMLNFLETELTTVETNNKVAWIIGNVNPGSRYCNTKWSRRYNILIERFQKVVRMQLFGHEAEESFQLQYPQDGT